MESQLVHWRKMWCLFQLKAEEFQRSYHRRSNVLLHNLARVVHAIEKYGIGVSVRLGSTNPSRAGGHDLELSLHLMTACMRLIELAFTDPLHCAKFAVTSSVESAMRSVVTMLKLADVIVTLVRSAASDALLLIEDVLVNAG